MSHDFLLEILQALSDLGIFGIAIGLMIEIIPSEIVLAYGGFLISTKKIGFVSALIAGVLGGTLAQLFLYWLGIYGGRPFFEKWGKYFFIHEKHLQSSEKWFEKYGNVVIFTARFIPIVRHAISIPAGVCKMKFSLFLIYSIAAMIPWTILFLLVGMELGTHWNQIESVGIKYIKPIALMASGVTLTYLLYHLFKNRTKSQ
ncbi:membrane protein DedA with SNARE-associated domain [Bacillus pakistanensis]|uniref:Membrane protein DedA with SNARE-associated domain n=1 Tax=Rossellomorea pakistanensis TaxID=992288 RepID=A0ABS2N8L9_9BACI|nr:DedA family protein [Bacillus pakistanensis]MBM7584202.1 membrane protein DedA with SNARE-associated domain [Bacillus pakistanensis]